MDFQKEQAQPSYVHNVEASDSDVPTEKRGTDADQMDMHRMGKQQVTKRNFRGLTIFGFSMVLLATWETQLSTAVFGLLNGGTAGVIWMYFIAFIAFGFVIASLAEIASMAPTSGGQYHWVSEFAPKSVQKFTSYIVGWLLVLGWQVGGASIAFFNGSNIQGLIILNRGEYEPKTWHGTLLAFSITTFAVVCNTTLARRLPVMEGIICILHIAGFFTIAIPLWVLADKADAKVVFTEFSDNAGWNSLGLSCLIGLIGGVNTFIGSDAAVHMSEEVRDAAWVVPRAMMWTWAGNGLMGFIMAITLCFCVGNVQEVLATPTNYPYIQVFYNVTGSKAGTTVMVTLMLVISTFACVTSIAACSRQLFAFARDRGLPFSSFFAQIHPGLSIPLNAILITALIAMLLAVINIGSSVAYNQIVSLGVGAMLTSYMLSIGCVLLRRIRSQSLLPSKFDLGRWGIAVNSVSMAFLALAFVMTFFPPAPHPNAESMNWSVLIYSAVIIFSVIYFAFRGRFEYAGPVAYVRRSA